MFYICQSFNSATSDDVISSSFSDQKTIQDVCRKTLSEYLNKNSHKNNFVLCYKSISQNLLKSLKFLPSKYEMLSCSQSWLCFWILNSLSILDVPLSTKLKNNVLTFILNSLFDPQSGGFGGGEGQLGHIASSYAVINTLVLLKATNIVDKIKMKTFLQSLKQSDGSFALQHNGEVDIRATYCSLSIARSLEILDDELCHGVAEQILQCQTYEGGFGAVPYAEAHGSYSFCAIAALTILGKEHQCDLPSLLRWLSRRQMVFEGGFNGRPNKLVDACYSFWVGSAHVLTERAMERRDFFNRDGLSQYLICCGQTETGLRDKPTKGSDLYHTMYGLAGLSLCYLDGENTLPSIVDEDNVIRILNLVDPLNGVAVVD